MKDGFQVYNKEDIEDISFDYFIVSSISYFNEIKNEILQLKLPGGYFGTPDY